MKILYVTPWFPTHKQDQQGNFILDSIESLIELGHEVIVLVTPSWKPHAKKIRKNDFSNKLNIRVHSYLSIPRGYCWTGSIWFYRKKINKYLEKIFKDNNCQIIHAHTELAGLSAVEVGKRLNIPVVVTLHGISTDARLYKGTARKLLFEYTLSAVKRVILVGKPLIDFAKQFVQKDDHFRVVSNGFRMTEKNKNIQPKEFNEKIRFISVSNLHEGKGIDINLYALAKLKEKGKSNWTYKIVGDGDQRKNLEELAINLNLQDQVIFIGKCNHDEVYAHLIQSDIFILPSYREAFGVAYLEAMSCGVLTIGVKGEGPEAFIQHGKTGLLVDPKNINDLVSKIESVWEDPETAKEIAINGQQHVNTNFTWQAHGKALETIYNELI